MTQESASQSSGFPFAIGAYLIWGLLPAYMLLVRSVPPLEFLSWRILFTLPVCLLLIVLLKRGRALLDTLQSPRLVAVLLLTALLIGGNWLVFIIAVTHDQVYAASLGYYMNPLVNILLGTLVLGEKLGRLQWAAVLLAGGGVAILLAGAWQTLWISLVLSLSFSFYGLIRKLVPVDAASGLTVESALLAAPSALYAWYLLAMTNRAVFGQDASLSGLVALSGIITATPLVMFTAAAKRMQYSSLAFVQFLSPSLIFLEGLLLYREPLHPAQAASFVLIWTAIGIFCWDLLSRRGKAA